MTTTTGVDVSNNNSAIPDGVEFAWLKASEGATFDDAKFEGFVDECNRRGIPWGPYHFPHPDRNTADAEAAWFLKCAQRGAMGWALDVETRKEHGVVISPMSVLGPDRLAAWCERFRTLVEPQLGRSWFYTFRSWAGPLFSRLGPEWRIWLSVMDGVAHVPSFAGRDVDMEQYGIVDGIDRNLARIPLTADPAPPHTGDDDMLFLIIGDGSNAAAGEGVIQYFTNWIDIIPIPDEHTRDVIRYVSALKGSPVASEDNGAPIRTPQAIVDWLVDHRAASGGGGTPFALNVTLAGRATPA